MKKRTIYIIVILAVVVLLGLVIMRKKGVIGKDNTLKVSVEKVAKRTIIETVTANGQIQPELEVIITPDVSGEIVELMVKEGDNVTKGQLLAKIDPELYQSNLEQNEAALNTQRANLSNAKARKAQAEAQFIKSESEYKRIKMLYDKGTVSTVEYESAVAAYKVAEAELEAAVQSVSAAQYTVQSAAASLNTARVNLTKTSIFAPIDGTVSKLVKEKGERVVGTSQFEGTEIMRIADLSRMEVNVEVSENDIIRVSLHDTATIEVEAFQGKRFKGLVTEIANSANVTGFSTEQVTNFEVKIRMLPSSYKSLVPEENPGISPFRPGMSATVDITTSVVNDALSVPIQAVTVRSDTTSRMRYTVKENGGEEERNPKTKEEAEAEKKRELKEMREYVFVFSEGRVKIREVETGIQDDEYMQIVKGLKEDEEVVVAPYSAISSKLYSGQRVVKVDNEKLYDTE